MRVVINLFDYMERRGANLTLDERSVYEAARDSFTVDVTLVKEFFDMGIDPLSLNPASRSLYACAKSKVAAADSSSSNPQLSVIMRDLKQIKLALAESRSESRSECKDRSSLADEYQESGADE